MNDTNVRKNGLTKEAPGQRRDHGGDREKGDVRRTQGGNDPDHLKAKPGRSSEELRHRRGE